MSLGGLATGVGSLGVQQIFEGEKER